MPARIQLEFYMQMQMLAFPAALLIYLHPDSSVSMQPVLLSSLNSPAEFFSSCTAQQSGSVHQHPQSSDQQHWLTAVSWAQCKTRSDSQHAHPGPPPVIFHCFLPTLSLSSTLTWLASPAQLPEKCCGALVFPVKVHLQPRGDQAPAAHSGLHYRNLTVSGSHSLNLGKSTTNHAQEPSKRNSAAWNTLPPHVFSQILLIYQVERTELAGKRKVSHLRNLYKKLKSQCLSYMRNPSRPERPINGNEEFMRFKEVTFLYQKGRDNSSDLLNLIFTFHAKGFLICYFQCVLTLQRSLQSRSTYSSTYSTWGWLEIMLSKTIL